MIFLLKFSKGHHSVKSIGRFTVLVLCTLSVLYISTKFRENIAKGFGVIERTRFVTDNNGKKQYVSPIWGIYKNIAQVK